MSDLQREIARVINIASAENNSNTPDFILAEFLQSCLDAFDAAVRQRDHWYGISPYPGKQYHAVKLTDVIKVWDILHTRNTGDLGYCDVEKAIEQVIGIENNISPEQPRAPEDVDDE